MTDDISALRPLHRWRDETTLVPFSGIQFLDFGFDDRATGFKSVKFVERTTGQSADGDERTLLVLTGDDEADERILGGEQPGDDEYEIKQAHALEPFVGKWTPVPVLRIRNSAGPAGSERYDAGPSCWARVLVKELPGPDPKSGHTHRVILALDTTCEPSESPLFYQAPSTEDGERWFRFVSDTEQAGWFVSRLEEDGGGALHDLQAWVDEWLLAQFEQVKRKPKFADQDGPPRIFEHWARFFALLRLLGTACAFPKIRLIDTMSRDPITDRHRYTPIDVDLVVDVGNSRTCGILIESGSEAGAVDLNDSYSLAIRDISNPLFRYNRPFESRIEFSDARFGVGRSPRSRAFFWPSLVRIGPEAMRLTKDEEGTETFSGLSSPKRYLWDFEPRAQDWRFHDFRPTTAEPLPLIARAVQNEMNEAGDVLDQVSAEIRARLRHKNEVSTIGAARPRFSRSATFGLMLSEIFLHALVQINDPAHRETRRQSAIPRRLRNIILTLPSATPMQEQAIIRSRAEGALKLLFKVLKWSPALSLNTNMPEIRVDWDEASCTQMVYLFSEVNRRAGGQIRGYFNRMGRPRAQAPGAPEEPSLRIGCIDVGGGTTDLMIMTYFAQSDHAIVPHQNFREGFRVAGDDLLHELIGRMILPQIATDLERVGVGHPKNLVKELFGGDMGDTDIRVYRRRRQFGLRILMPAALACLAEVEGKPQGGAVSVRLGDVLEADAGAAAAYLHEAAAARGASADWRLEDLTIHFQRHEFDALARGLFQRPLGDLTEVIGHLGCDVVLLSGRPSRLEAVRGLIREAMVVPPHRLISMHQYEVGGWYPFRDPVTNRIGDPKTTAAVGAMLCLMAPSRIVNFNVDTNRMFMTSTARFIGQLDNDNVIRESRILFRDVDGEAGVADNPNIELFAPTFIGFRQLPHERWTTSVLYHLYFANEQVARRPKPFLVKLERREFDADPESQAEALRAEALKEALVISEIEDGAGDAAKPSDILLKLHTLGLARDYWLDSGLFKL